jgi:hypothetical protein
MDEEHGVRRSERIGRRSEERGAVLDRALLLHKESSMMKRPGAHPCKMRGLLASQESSLP